MCCRRRRPANAQFPLTGHAQGTYRFGPGELELAELTAATRATQVHASGTLSSSAALKLVVTTTNLGEWQPVFSAAGYAGQIPVTLKGHASFNGTATGKLSQIAIAGNVQSQDFETTIPATAYTPERTINWNALQADVQLSPSVFAVRNGTLSRDPDSLKFDFHAQLAGRQFTDSSPFQAHLDTQNADLTGILALAGYSYPVTGIVDLHMQMSGTRSLPQGEGSLQLRDGSIYGEPVQHLTSSMSFKGEEVELKNVQLAYRESNVAGGGTYNLSSHAYRFNLTGNNFDLARVTALQSARIAVTGRADFTAEGSGTLEAPGSMRPFISTILRSTRNAPATSPSMQCRRARNCGSRDNPSSNRQTSRSMATCTCARTGPRMCTSASTSWSWTRSSKPTCAGR